MKHIYFDNAATTQTDLQVVKAMQPYLMNFYGNASSLHTCGLKSKKDLEKSRLIIAQSIKAKPNEIIFTSGGTESDNLALKGIAWANKKKGNHLITTQIEHKAVLNSCKWLTTQGFKITYLPVDKHGFIDLNELKKTITPKTILISIIHANNEIGTLQDLEAVGKICAQHKIYFHTDACQSYTKTEIDVKKFNLDLVSLNAHKIHGPKGIGALYVKNGTQIEPWQHGGNHEHKLRAGTENIPAIIGFSKAVELAKQKDILKMTQLRDKLIKEIQKIPDTYLNGPTGKKRLCNNINFSFKGVEGESLGKLLDDKGIATSTGSACSALTLEPSYILKAIGLSDELANSSLRISLSRFNTLKEIDYLIKILPNIIQKLRKISPIY
ncbi:MAG: cysteine desulfurase family protein [Patescibacteria group bacterium]|nr:cysteine desulfurase family protein [Patescibacteria group bacterium]